MNHSSTLSILESLSDSSDLSQRKIAARTGLNLSKVNFVLRKLIAKGFVKLRRVLDNPHKRKYLYILTPAGMAHKSVLTYWFLRQTLQQYQEAEQKVANSVDSMVGRGVGRVVLWGNTELTDLCLRLLESTDDAVEVLGVVDPTGRHPRAINPSGIRSMGASIILCDPEVDNLPSGVSVWRLE